MTVGLLHSRGLTLTCGVVPLSGLDARSIIMDCAFPRVLVYSVLLWCRLRWSRKVFHHVVLWLQALRSNPVLRPRSTSCYYWGPLWTLWILVHHAVLILVLVLALVLVLVPVPRTRPRSPWLPPTLLLSSRSRTAVLVLTLELELVLVLVLVLVLERVLERTLLIWCRLRW